MGTHTRWVMCSRVHWSWAWSGMSLLHHTPPLWWWWSCIVLLISSCHAHTLREQQQMYRREGQYKPQQNDEWQVQHSSRLERRQQEDHTLQTNLRWNVVHVTTPWHTCCATTEVWRGVQHAVKNGKQLIMAGANYLSCSKHNITP